MKIGIHYILCSDLGRCAEVGILKDQVDGVWSMMSIVWVSLG